MSASPATKLFPAHVGNAAETKTATRSRPIRQGSLALAVAAALAACTGGGIGPDTQIKPVDLTCTPNAGNKLC